METQGFSSLVSRHFMKLLTSAFNNELVTWNVRMYNKILPNTVWCYWAGNVLCATQLQRVKLRKSLPVIHFWYMDTLSCLTWKTLLAYFETGFVFLVSWLLKWNQSLVRSLWFKLCEISIRGVFWSICGRLIIQSRLLGSPACKGVCYVLP